MGGAAKRVKLLKLVKVCGLSGAQGLLLTTTTTLGILREIETIGHSMIASEAIKLPGQERLLFIVLFLGWNAQTELTKRCGCVLCSRCSTLEAIRKSLTEVIPAFVSLIVVLSGVDFFNG